MKYYCLNIGEESSSRLCYKCSLVNFNLDILHLSIIYLRRDTCMPFHEIVCLHTDKPLEIFEQSTTTYSICMERISFLPFNRESIYVMERLSLKTKGKSEAILFDEKSRYRGDYTCRHMISSYLYITIVIYYYILIFLSLFA
jgi:hypothetical protein